MSFAGPRYRLRLIFRVVDFILIVRSFWEGGYFSISTHVCFVVAVFCVLVSAMSLYSAGAGTAWHNREPRTADVP